MRVRSFVITALAGLSAVAVPAAAMEVVAPPRPKVAARPAADKPAPPVDKPAIAPAAKPSIPVEKPAPVADRPAAAVAPAVETPKPTAPVTTVKPVEPTVVKDPMRIPLDKQELKIECIAGRPDGAPAVKCRWTAAEGARHYVLFRKVADTATEPEPIFRGSDTWFVDRTVVEGTGYGYAVKALNADGQVIGRGGIAWVRCCGEQPPEKQPMRLACMAGQPEGAPAVKCQWSPLDGADHYVLYRKVEGADPERISTGTDTTFVDRAVVDGTPYNYGVKALDAGGRVIGMSTIVLVRCCPVDGA